MTTDSEEEKEGEVHCRECGVIAFSPEEARANGFCQMKAFDARRLVVGGNDEEDQQEATGRLKDGYYWLCPDCFVTYEKLYQ